MTTSADQHVVPRAMLTALRKKMEQNSWELRKVEAMISEARLKGPLDQMQMSMNGAALMAKTTRDACDAGLMLIGKLFDGLEENEKQRARIEELEAQLNHPVIGCLN